jgi:starch synthase
MVTAEFAPLAKTGGLADVAAGLSRYLADIGQDVRLFLPDYARIDHSRLDVHRVEFLQDIPITFGDWTVRCSIDSAGLPGGQRIYLVRCPVFFGRPDLYCGDGDEHLRFALLTRAAIEACQRMGWGPDIFHVNDWHTALLPLYLRTLYGWDGLFRQSRSVLTIHNIGYQGTFPADVMNPLGFREHASLLHQEDLQRGMLSFLKMGIIYADVLTTVSRTYAREIQTETYGVGLHEFLRARDDHLVGIVNGIDYHDWNPEADP